MIAQNAQTAQKGKRFTAVATALVMLLAALLLAPADSYGLSVADVIVDNTDSGFEVVSGTWSTSTILPGYYGTNYRSSSSGTGTAKARWTPNLPESGHYKVYVKYTADTNRATNAPYMIQSVQSNETVRINQQTGHGAWVLLGSFRFDAGSSGYVELSNNANGHVIADAVRFVPELLLADDFEDGTAAWTVVQGSWIADSDGANGIYRTTTTAGEALTVAGDAAWIDYSFEASVRINAAGSRTASGIAFRYTDADNYYLLRFQHDQQKLRLHRIAGGVWTTLAERSFASVTGQWYSLQAVAVGDKLEAYVDGDLKLTAVDAAHSAGKVGFRTYDADTSWDDAAVRPRTAAFFRDIGQISALPHAMPSIIAVDNDTVTIGAQVRYVTTVPGGHFEKGAADIVTFRSTDKGDTWGPVTYVYETDGVDGDSGYSSVFVKDGGKLLSVYAVGPQNWDSSDLVVHQKESLDGGATWSAASTPTIVNDHPNAKPTNGGKGYQHTNGRLIIPARRSLLYSDNGGATWTATAQFTSHVETKVQPHYDNGMMSDTALVPWRTQSQNGGRIERVSIASTYAHSGTTMNTFGAHNNLGFVRYDEQTLLMSVTRDSDASSPLYIRVSADEGATWTNEKVITASARSARYSDIAVMPDGTIVVVFMLNNMSAASGSPLHVVKFNMDWLLQ